MSIGVLHGKAGGGKGAALIVTAPAGSTVTVSKDGKSKTKVAGSDGIVVFKGLQSGKWTLTSTDGTHTASETVEIVADYATEISYNVIPEFTYTGDYEIVNDADETITVSQENWKIRFLTSGTLKFTDLRSAENGIDVFLVGGGGAGGASCYVNSENPLWGGGGGGGGYTNTQKEVSVTQGTTYTITVGAGGTGVSGANGNDGGSSSAFGISANGGKGGYAGTTQTNGRKGGAGGSGGGAGGKYSKDTGSSTASGAGGSDGGNGGGSSGGTGQGTTTREFGESTGTLYAGGGGGAKSSSGSNSAGGSGGGTAGNGENASANTGGGGGGGSTPANGGSGIIIIRNKR